MVIEELESEVTTCSLTVHPAENGYLVATLGKLKAVRKGPDHPLLLCRWPRILVPLTDTPQSIESYKELIFTFTFYTKAVHNQTLGNKRTA